MSTALLYHSADSGTHDQLNCRGIRVCVNYMPYQTSCGHHRLFRLNSCPGSGVDDDGVVQLVRVAPDDLGRNQVAEWPSLCELKLQAKPAILFDRLSQLHYFQGQTDVFGKQVPGLYLASRIPDYPGGQPLPRIQDCGPEVAGNLILVYFRKSHHRQGQNYREKDGKPLFGGMQPSHKQQKSLRETRNQVINSLRKGPSGSGRTHRGRAHYRGLRQTGDLPCRGK